MKNRLISYKLNFFIILLLSYPALAADRFWVHKPFYENFFSSPAELSDWNIVEDNGTGSWILTGNGTALLTMDNAAGSFANRMFNVNGGAPRLLPLNIIDGRVEIMVRAITGGNQRIFVQVQQFNASNTYLGEFSILPGQSATGFFSINLSDFSWNGAADKVRFIIGGENYSGQQGTIEFDYFSYSNGNGNWNNSANWSAVSDGPGGASVPSAADMAIFDGAGDNNGSCLLTAAATIAGIQFGSGYSGNFDLRGYQLTVGSGGAAIAGGGITGNGAVILINGNINISGGAYKNTLGHNYASGDVTISGGVLDFSSGDVIFNAAGDQQFNSTMANPIHKFIVDKPSGVVNFNSDMLISDSIVLTQGILQTNGYIIRLGLSSTAIGKLITGNGKINGTLKRWISNSTTGDIIFPLGNAVTDAPVTLTINSAASTGGSLTVAYTDASPGFDAVSFSDGISTINGRSTSSWNILTSGISGGSYSLTAANNHLATITNLSDLHFTLSGSVTATHQPATGTLSNPLLHRTALTAANLAQTWYASVAAVALPITWGKFTATAINNDVVLQWSTLQESNTSHFAIEDSVDGVIFTKIGETKAAGNSSNISNYTFTHLNPTAGKVNYYKLKQTDNDNRFLYSGIISAKINSLLTPAVISVSNPVHNELKITCFKNNISISITDINGRVFTQQMLQAGTNIINSSKWSAGIYQVSIFEKNNLEEVLRILKQ